MTWLWLCLKTFQNFWDFFLTNRYTAGLAFLVARWVHSQRLGTELQFDEVDDCSTYPEPRVVVNSTSISACHFFGGFQQKINWKWPNWKTCLWQFVSIPESLPFSASIPVMVLWSQSATFLTVSSTLMSVSFGLCSPITEPRYSL